MFNGQGNIIHISGMLYEGIWIAGRPAGKYYLDYISYLIPW